MHCMYNVHLQQNNMFNGKQHPITFEKFIAVLSFEYGEMYR
jgi:hypothetical protein